MGILRVLVGVLAAAGSAVAWFATISLVMLVAVYISKLVPLGGHRRSSKTRQSKSGRGDSRDDARFRSPPGPEMFAGRLTKNRHVLLAPDCSVDKPDAGPEGPTRSRAPVRQGSAASACAR